MKLKDKSKPLMLYVAEEIYINISNIKKKKSKYYFD